MQAMWKVGATGIRQRRLLVLILENRFHECLALKNIIESLRKLYDAVNGGSIKAKALQLIGKEL